VTALVVVAGLFAYAALSVRHAVQGRRLRAERAWNDATQCLLGAPLGPTESSGSRLVRMRQASAKAAASSWPRACAAVARAAEQAALDLPEHKREQFELASSLHDLAQALDSGNDARLPNALDRVRSQGSVLGFHPLEPGKTR
jgi:hypothetical protein